MDDYATYTYDAIWFVATGLHDFLYVKQLDPYDMNNRVELYNSILNAKVTGGATGDISMDSDGQM